MEESGKVEELSVKGGRASYNGTDRIEFDSFAKSRHSGEKPESRRRTPVDQGNHFRN